MLNPHPLGKPLRNIALCLLLLAEGHPTVASASAAQAGAAALAEKGPAVGQQIPAFAAYDQFGKEQTLATLTGADGLVLLFVRSADW